MGFSLHPIMLTAATTIAAFAQLPGYAVARAVVQQQEYGLRQLRGAGAHDGPLASGGGTSMRTSAALWIEAREGNIGSGEGPLRKLLQGCQHQECLEQCSACTFIQDDDLGHCKTSGQLFNCMRLGTPDGAGDDGGNGGAVPSPRLKEADRQHPEGQLTVDDISIASHVDTKTLDSFADGAPGESAVGNTPSRKQYDGYTVERGPQISVDYEHPVGALVAMKSARRTSNYAGAVVYGVSALSHMHETAVRAEHAASSSRASDEDATVWARRLLSDYATGGEVEDVMYYIDDGKYFVEAGPHIEVDYANGVPMEDYHDYK